MFWFAIIALMVAPCIAYWLGYQSGYDDGWLAARRDYRHRKGRTTLK